MDQQQFEELVHQRISNFITQVRNDVQKDKPGVYIIVVNDRFVNLEFPKTTTADIRFIKEANIADEINIAKLYSCDTIVEHIETRQTRTHTIIFTYGCDNASGEHFSLSGPI